MSLMNIGKKKILVLAGGKSSEHDISLISKKYVLNQLAELNQVDITEVIFPKNGSIPPKLNFEGYDFIVPCFHGYPGETGDIQSALDIHGSSYLGSGSEAHKSCFNKITTKLYLDSLGIPNTLFIYGQRLDASFKERAIDFFQDNPSGVFIKAARQGSSIGCAPVTDINQLEQVIDECFKHDSYLLIEKMVKARELEVSAFEFQGKLHITLPGEVLPPDSDFYSFEEKYSSDSSSQTNVEATLSSVLIEEIQTYARDAFESLEVRDLARIDFFLTEENEVFLNEINTFPGLTPISMFPQMMENYGVSFKDFLMDRIHK